VLGNLAARQAELKARLLLERRGISPATLKKVQKDAGDEIAYRLMLRSLKPARGLKRMRAFRVREPLHNRTPLA
jgi:hypothetical protein